MKPLVSVVITEASESMYLVRCVNSIMHQTHDEMEVIIVDDTEKIRKLVADKEIIILDNNNGNKWDKLNEAVKSAKGEYLFFCDATSVLTSGLLSNLILKAKDALGIAEVYVVNENGTNRKLSNEFSIVGKFLETKILKDQEIRFDNEDICPEYRFLSQYARVCSQINFCKQGAIYENSDTFKFNLEKNFNISAIKVELSGGYLSIESAQYFIIKMLESIEASNMANMENKMDVIELALAVLNIYETFPEFNYKIADGYLKKLFIESLEWENNSIWEKFQKYFANLNNADLIKVLLPVFGLNAEKVQLIKKYSVREYKFYESMIPQEERYCIEDNEKILAAIEALNKKIEQISVVSQVGNKKEIIYQKQYLQGMELGTYVIGEYGAGRMGLKFIMKFFVAWIKHKFVR